jgi:hypothetical protein
MRTVIITRFLQPDTVLLFVPFRSELNYQIHLCGCAFVVYCTYDYSRREICFVVIIPSSV